jgi:CRP/FNR family transcriptional regulator
MPVTARDLLAGMPFPPQLAPSLRRALVERAQVMTVASGTTLYRPGDAMDVFLLLGGGAIRVFKASEDGREITLYNVGPSECCTINVLCLLTDRPSPATAFVEESAQALAYSRADFLDWFGAEPTMRDLVLGQMADRVHTMMGLVVEVAFRRLDQRLAAYLLAAAAEDGPLALTHEAVAMELGSVREVVSRILKNFESARLVELGRGRIVVKDRAGLQAIVGA